LAGRFRFYGKVMKELFVLFLLALLIVPPVVGIRRVRRVLRQAPPREPGASTDNEA
jgi:hypothetical protein